MAKLLIILVAAGVLGLLTFLCVPTNIYLSTDDQILRLNRQILAEITLQTTMLEAMHNEMIGEIK